MRMSDEEVDEAVCSSVMGTAIAGAGGESSVDSGEGADCDDGCCVHWTFFLSWSRWPLAVASDGVMSDSLIKSMPRPGKEKTIFDGFEESGDSWAATGSM